MTLDFTRFELPVLEALTKLGGNAKPKEAYPVIEQIMGLSSSKNPEEYGKYKDGKIKWKNKAAWAREYLKRKGQLDGRERGVWKITKQGKERVQRYLLTKKDPDEGMALLQGIDTSIADNFDISPSEGFDKIENIQIHETGDILGVKGIVYEPVNEQGVILLFAALCHDLGYMIEGIRGKFPDALLRRKNDKGTWNSCRAEFEFQSSNFKLHKHNPKHCDLVVCWEHDWTSCPIEVLCLKKEVKKFR